MVVRRSCWSGHCGRRARLRLLWLLMWRGCLRLWRLWGLCGRCGRGRVGGMCGIRDVDGYSGGVRRLLGGLRCHVESLGLLGKRLRLLNLGLRLLR